MKKGVTMNNFNDGAPRKPKDWIELGYNVFPCFADGTPGSKGWDNATNFKALLVSKTYKHNVLGLRLDNIVDLDIDNPIMAPDILLMCLVVSDHIKKIVELKF